MSFAALDIGHLAAKYVCKALFASPSATFEARGLRHVFSREVRRLGRRMWHKVLQKYVSESSIAANTHSSGCAQSRRRARLASFGPPFDSSYRMGVGGSDGS